MNSLVNPFIDPTTDMVFTKGAGAKCDQQRIGVRALVRANLDLDVRGACVRRKKQSQLTPCSILHQSYILDYLRRTKK